MNKRISLALTFAIVVSLLAAASAYAVPPLPSGFYGSLSIDGANAPDGALVTAWIDGSPFAQAVVFIWNGSSVYTLDVPGDDPDTPDIEGATEGALVVFKIDGQLADQTGVWHSGSNVELNLTAPGLRPQIVLVEPDNAPQASALAVSITTSDINLQGGDSLSFGQDITVSTTSILDASHATADISIDPNAALGPRTITLTTPAGPLTRTNAFTVTPAITGIRVQLPIDATGCQGERALVPALVLDDVTGKGIYAFAFDLLYNPAILRFVGTSQAGTLSAGWTIVNNHSSPGRARVVGTGVNPLTGSGTLVDLVFEVQGSPGIQTDLVLRDFRFNEGDPPTTSFDGLFTVCIDSLMMSITGQVSYLNWSPVPSTTLAVTGEAGQLIKTTTSDIDGAYTLVMTSTDTFTVTASKTGDQRGAISALDAAWIREHDADPKFASYQLESCDVSANGTCTAYDAAIIERYLVGLSIPSQARAGEWGFNPLSRSYIQPDQDLDDQDYAAFLFGDVTYNWGQAGTNQLLAPQQAVLVSLPSLVASAGQSLAVPVQVNDVTDLDVRGYELTISYDPSVLQVESVSTDASLSQDWLGAENLAQPGLIRIVRDGQAPLSGQGTLLYLNFTVVGQAGQHSPLAFQALRLNEGQPPAQASDGQIVIGQIVIPEATTFLPLMMMH